MAKKYFVFTLNAEPLFSLENSFISFFYEIINKISKQGEIILCTDLNYNNAIKLSKLMNLSEGYIITSCGSSIYDVKNNKCISSSYIKKTLLHPVLRQAIINTDSIVLHSKENLLLYSSSYELGKYVYDSNEKIDKYFTHNYNDVKKFINKNKVEYVEIYNHNYGIKKYYKNEEIMKLTVENISLFYNRLLTNRVIITNTNFQHSIDYILKNNKEEYTAYLINLTNIFDNQKINYNVSCDVKYNLDFLFKNRTFHMFEKSLKSSLISSGIMYEEEDAYV